MRRLIAMFSLTCLLGIGTGSATGAQSPLASPIPIGQRVEVPEEGFAFTFPEAWQVQVRPRDPDAGGVHVVTAEAPQSTGATCDAWRDVPDGLWIGPIEEGAEWHLDQRHFYPPLPTITRDAVHLPAGDAFRVHADWTEGTNQGASETWYWWRGDEGDDYADYALHCVADPLGSSPDDRWLSIAETFEFLPVEE